MSKINRAIENIMCHYMEGKSVREISDITDLPESFVKDVINTENKENWEGV